MNTPRPKTAQLLLALMLVIMSVPLALSFMPASKGPALFGIQKQTFSEADFAIAKILSHQTQDKFETAAKQTVGGCNYAIRLYNELNYRLFHYSAAPKLILGKDDYFYENIYIQEYTGQDFVGQEAITNQVRKFKALQDKLAQQGIHLLLVIEPSKVWYLPEYLPKGYCKGPHTNYEVYRQTLLQQHVTFLDLNQFFIQKKNKVQHPLYSKHGIHWSTYGLWNAADTLQQFITAQTGLKLGHFKHLTDTFSTVNKDLDFDLEPPMNLWKALPHERLCFPVMECQASDTSKPKAFIIADSYVWSLWDRGILAHWFLQPEFWYYNATVYPNIWDPTAVYADKSNLPDKLKQQQIVLLMMTTANLKDFGWGFLDEVH
ncbi:MAG: hypothetical protein MJZ57_04625 [Bacteroidales bacterium]|nr:hypothetical protein [Bacteroidales bacterium]